MGRHRNDPRGTGQVVAMAGVIVLFITLVVLGGYFLYRSLPGNSDVVVGDDPPGTSAEAQSGSVGEEVLHIRVVGDSSEVLVRVPGGEVLTDTTMEQGQYVSYDHPELAVTIGEPDAVEVHVNGEPRKMSGEDPGYSFTAAEA